MLSHARVLETRLVVAQWQRSPTLLFPDLPKHISQSVCMQDGRSR
jgi:hypothetical protein